MAHHLHPEFGWFCPSASLRRTGRMALRALVCSVIVGALALRAGRGPSVNEALTIAHVDPVRPVAATIETDGRAVSAERPRAPDLGKSACEGASWSFSPGKCNAGTTRRVLVPRAANEAPLIAAFPLGRSTPLEPAQSPGSVDLADADLTDITNSPVPTPTMAAPLNGEPHRRGKYEANRVSKATTATSCATGAGATIDGPPAAMPGQATDTGAIVIQVHGDLVKTPGHAIGETVPSSVPRERFSPKALEVGKCQRGSLTSAFRGKPDFRCVMAK